MPDVDHPDRLAATAALIGRRKPGYGLPASFHLDRDIFDLEMSAIFGRHWLYVGVDPDVPEPGDFVTVEFGRYSIILVRGSDMQVRGFHNVCRHRGSRLVHDASGSVAKFVCRYHHWAYELSGPLAHAEHLPPEVDRSCLGLKRVHVESIAGLLFISVAETPPDDIEEMRRTVEAYLAPHDLRNCKVAHQTDSIEDGNWKIVMENNRECHHCDSHPELIKSYFQFFAHSEADVKPRQRRYYQRYLRAREEMNTIWQSAGLPHALIEALDDRVTPFRLERLALDDAGESYTLDTKVACKRLLGNFTQPRLGALSLHTQPNSWHHFLSDHAVVFSVFPISPERTLLRTKWLVHKDAVAGEDYDLDNLTRVWLRTNEQDARFVAWQYAGVRNPAYEPGPFCPNENQLEKFYCWYLGRLEAYIAETRAR